MAGNKGFEAVSEPFHVPSHRPILSRLALA
jgi:hypothetical protein